MTEVQKIELREGLKKAFIEAIEMVGFDAFKKTSFFASNERVKKEYEFKLAA